MAEAEAQPQIELIDADVPRGEVIAPVPVIRDVNWRIYENEFWVVGAPPGAGKTDLLSTAMGLLKPIKGFHLLFGRDTRTLDEEEFVDSRRKVGLVFSDGRLFSQYTVEENVALPVRYHQNLGVERATQLVERALEVTGLRHLSGRFPDQVIRSLHQRIGLARALVMEPEVILIDNPLAGSDPRQVRWWIEFLSEATRGNPKLGRKLTVAVTTDDFRPWAEAAGHFAVINEKRFAVIGGTGELERSREPAVRELMAGGWVR